MRQGVLRNAGLALGGASLSLGFAPFGFWPVVPVAFALLIYLCSDSDWKTASQRAYIFGLGMFGAGVSWISESFQFNNLHGPIVPLLTLSFVAFLALFPASWGALLRSHEAAWESAQPSWSWDLFCGCCSSGVEDGFSQGLPGFNLATRP